MAQPPDPADTAHDKAIRAQDKYLITGNPADRAKRDDAFREFETATADKPRESR